MRNLLQQRRGFGLLEVLLATAIFIVVIGSMVSLNQMAVRNAVLANHRTQAYNLAEDAIETIRQMRDTNWIDGPQVPGVLDSSNRWLAMVHDCSANGSGPIRHDAYTVVGTGIDYGICFDPAIAGDGRFGLMPATTDNSTINLGAGSGNTFEADPGSPTYTRKIRFETPSATDLQFLNEDAAGKVSVMNGITAAHTIKVTVTVTWRDFDQDWSADISTILTNWKGL